MIEKFKTVKNSCEYKFKEIGSEFISFVFPVENEEEANKKFNELKKKNFDATHHCFAFRLHEEIKYSDDREPSGTAGIRILNAIDHFELDNIIVIVVRYFGGTKLGVGPLGKAYYHSAFKVLENADVIEKKAHRKLLIESEFDQINILYRLIDQFNGKIENSKYEENAEFKFVIEMVNAEKFISELRELSNGKIEAQMDEKIFYM